MEEEKIEIIRMSVLKTDKNGYAVEVKVNKNFLNDQAGRNILIDNLKQVLETIETYDKEGAKA